MTAAVVARSGSQRSGGGRSLAPDRQYGGALIAMVLVTLTLMAISMAYISFVPVALRSTRSQTARTHARYWALEAAARARLELLGGGDGNLDGNALARTLAEPAADEDDAAGAHTLRGAADGSFRARATPLPEPQTLLVESAATMDGFVQQLAQVVKRTTTSPYRAALFAGTAIELGTTQRLVTDSYDATAGTYAAQAVNTVTMPDGSQYTYARDRGKIAASDGSIAAPDGAVFGDAQPGVSGTFQPSANTYVTGSTVPVAVAERFEPFEYDPPAENDNAEPAFAALLSGDIYWGVFLPPATIPEGTYVVEHFVTLGQQVTITGHVRLYVDGLFYVLSNSAITLAPGASLEVHMGGLGDALVTGTGIVNSGENPANVRLYVARGPSGGPQVQIAQTADLYGTVYAPESTVDVRTNRIRGALVADVITLNGGTEQRISFDEALEHLEDAAPRLTRYETVATWWLTR